MSPGRWLSSVFLILVTAAAPGCGYALAGRGSFLPVDIKTVAIPPVENRTPFQRIELPVTQKIRDEFIGRGKFKLADLADANAVLRAEIVSVTVQPIGLNEQQLGSRYLATMVVKASFARTVTNEVLWSNDALIFREEYDLSIRGPIEASSFVDQQGSAVQRIATDVARTLVTAIVEAF